MNFFFLWCKGTNHRFVRLPFNKRTYLTNPSNCSILETGFVMKFGDG